MLGFIRKREEEPAPLPAVAVEENPAVQKRESLRREFEAERSELGRDYWRMVRRLERMGEIGKEIGNCHVLPLATFEDLIRLIQAARPQGCEPTDNQVRQALRIFFIDVVRVSLADLGTRYHLRW